MPDLNNAKIYKKVSNSGSNQYAVVNLDATNFCITFSSTNTSTLVGAFNNLDNKYAAKSHTHTAADVGALKNYGNTNSRPNGTTFTLPGGANIVQMRSGATSGSDIGIMYLSDDNAFVCNSSDVGYLFATFDTDKTANFSTAANAAFAVLSDHAGVSLKGSLTVAGSIYENGNALSATYAAKSHTHSYADLADVSTIGTTVVSTSTITTTIGSSTSSTNIPTEGAVRTALNGYTPSGDYVTKGQFSFNQSTGVLTLIDLG